MEKRLKEKLTKEQIIFCNKKYTEAAKYFNLQKGWVLHHKDDTLMDSDTCRYIEWRIEDLIPMTKSEHMRLHQTGDKNNFCEYNRTHKEEISERMKELWRSGKIKPHKTTPNYKAIQCVETGEIFKSLKDAREFLGICAMHRQRILDGKKIGGYHWRYIDDIKTKER